MEQRALMRENVRKLSAHDMEARLNGKDVLRSPFLQAGCCLWIPPAQQVLGTGKNPFGRPCHFGKRKGARPTVNSLRLSTCSVSA